MTWVLSHDLSTVSHDLSIITRLDYGLTAITNTTWPELIFTRLDYGLVVIFVLYNHDLVVGCTTWFLKIALSILHNLIFQKELLSGWPRDPKWPSCRFDRVFVCLNAWAAVIGLLLVRRALIGWDKTASTCLNVWTEWAMTACADLLT